LTEYSISTSQYSVNTHSIISLNNKKCGMAPSILLVLIPDSLQSDSVSNAMASIPTDCLTLDLTMHIFKSKCFLMHNKVLFVHM